MKMIEYHINPNHKIKVPEWVHRPFAFYNTGIIVYIKRENKYTLKGTIRADNFSQNLSSIMINFTATFTIADEIEKKFNNEQFIGFWYHHQILDTFSPPEGRPEAPKNEYIRDKITLIDYIMPRMICKEHGRIYSESMIVNNVDYDGAFVDFPRHLLDKNIALRSD